MPLASRLTLTGPPESEPEDFLSSSLGVIFPDDVMNQHGDADHGLAYTSPHLPKPLQISLADPNGEDDRQLFSHYLWDASLLLAELVEAGTLGLTPATKPVEGETGNPSLGAHVSEFNIANLRTIELGAGTALPSIMSALLGAHRVFVTDYPAPTVMKTLRENIAHNVKPEYSPLHRIPDAGVEIQGHSWGDLDETWAQENRQMYDRVFVADCLWMPWQHDNLRQSIDWFMGSGPGARAWIVAGFHTGREKMRSFFQPAQLLAHNLEIERRWEQDCDGNMRPWADSRGIEDIAHRKRWLTVAILRRPCMDSGPIV